MENNKKIIEEMQLVAEQMRLDDIEENPDILDDFFDCDCCGENKCLAGSIEYDGYRLCNDCVLIAETCFALKKISAIQELIDSMEDNRLEKLCDFLKQEDKHLNN